MFFGIALWAGTAVTASNLHALPPHRKPVRGGDLEPAGHRVVRKYTETDHMPSLFSEEEETYDRYAACLAATEGLRRLRDRDITDEMQAASDAEEAKKKRKEVATQYVQNSSKVLKALGMSVSQFNELGKEIAKDNKLKEKVRYSVMPWWPSSSLVAFARGPRRSVCQRASSHQELIAEIGHWHSRL